MGYLWPACTPKTLETPVPTTDKKRTALHPLFDTLHSTGQIYKLPTLPTKNNPAHMYATEVRQRHKERNFLAVDDPCSLSKNMPYLLLLGDPECTSSSRTAPSYSLFVQNIALANGFSFLVLRVLSVWTSKATNHHSFIFFSGFLPPPP